VVAPAHRLKAYSHLYWAVNLGFAVGTAIAGLVADVSFVALFVGDALTTLICAGLLYRYAPESRPAPDRAAQRKGGSLLTPFLDRVFAPFVVLNFLTALIFFQHLVAMPLAMERQGMPTRDYGLSIALNGVLIVLL
jgi:predicted MFS family arabinose efflux permease